jgi:hypothetical protein
VIAEQPQVECRTEHTSAHTWPSRLRPAVFYGLSPRSGRAVDATRPYRRVGGLALCPARGGTRDEDPSGECSESPLKSAIRKLTCSAPTISFSAFAFASTASTGAAASAEASRRPKIRTGRRPQLYLVALARQGSTSPARRPANATNPSSGEEGWPLSAGLRRTAAGSGLARLTGRAGSASTAPCRCCPAGGGARTGP